MKRPSSPEEPYHTTSHWQCRDSNLHLCDFPAFDHFNILFYLKIFLLFNNTYRKIRLQHVDSKLLCGSTWSDVYYIQCCVIMLLTIVWLPAKHFLIHHLIGKKVLTLLNLPVAGEKYMRYQWQTVCLCPFNLVRNKWVLFIKTHTLSLNFTLSW